MFIFYIFPIQIMREIVVHNEEYSRQLDTIHDVDVDIFMDLSEAPQNSQDIHETKVSDMIQEARTLLNQLNPSKENLMQLKDHINALGSVPVKVNGKYRMIPIVCSITEPSEETFGMHKLNIDLRDDTIEFHIDYLYNNDNSKQTPKEWVNNLRVGSSEDKGDTLVSKADYYINNGQMTEITDTKGSKTYNNSTSIDPFLEAGLSFINTTVVNYLKNNKN